MAFHNTEIGVVKMSRIRLLDKKVKAIAAAAGGGALVALGIVGVLTGGTGPATPAVVSAPQMSLGDTATAAYSATEETSMAVPVDKAPPYGGSGG
jgi:hypothetical protein